LDLRERGDTEVGGFGICDSDDLLYVEDVQLVKQNCTSASVAFDDESVADFFDRQVDAGRQPSQFARIWLHTHPGDSPQPSMTDEETFTRAFGRADWSIMIIVAQGGQTYARLQLSAGPGASIEIPVEVDFNRPFSGSDWEAWEKEYVANVQAAFEGPLAAAGVTRSGDLPPSDWLDEWDQYTDPDADPEIAYIQETETAHGVERLEHVQ